MLGKVIGNYKLMAEIGRGPYGVVYRALDLGRGREVALKAIHASLTEQVELSERLRSLAPTIAQFRHPQLAEFYTTLQLGADRYLVTELIEGKTLADKLQHAGVLSAEDAGNLIAQVCTPLAWLHRAGWAHGDLKPTNILIGRDAAPKITDLGLAYALAEQAVHTSATGLAYRAPEQLRAIEFDARTDVYALGAMLYELVTGLLPFRRISDAALLQAHLQEDVPSPRNYFPLIPDELENILLKALAKRPEDRFASPAEMQSALFEWLRIPYEPVTSNKPASTPVTHTVITQRAPDEMAIPTLEVPTVEEIKMIPTLQEFPLLELEAVPDTASFADDDNRRVTKPIAAHAPVASVASPEPVSQATPPETDSGRLRRVTAVERMPLPEPVAKSPTAMFDEVTVELDDSVLRRRSRWKPWLAVAGLAAAVGIPYAMMQGNDATPPTLPTRSTLNFPSPTVTPQPSPLADTAVVPPVTNAKPILNAKKEVTPRATVSPKATPKVTPTVVPIKRATPLPVPTAKPAIRATPTPIPVPMKKAGKAAPTPYPQPNPKEKEKDKKKGGLGGFFKEILTGKDKEKNKKAEPSATPKKKY